MIEFTHATAKFTVKPENASKYRDLLEKPKKHKFVGLSPVKYAYPIFTPGMTTAEYVAAFNRQFDGIRVKLDHDCPNYHAPAPMLDATQPEVLEEANPDYVEQAPAPKRKTATAAQLRVARLEGLLRRAVAWVDEYHASETEPAWVDEARGELQ